MSVFLLLLFGFFLLNCWMLWRLWRTLRGAGIVRGLACLAMLVLMLGFFLTYRFDWLPRPVADAWLLGGSLWLAFFWYALLLTLVVDLFRLGNRLFGWFPSLRQPAPRVRYAVCGAIAGIAFAICAAGWWVARHPVVREVRIDAARQGEKAQTMTLAVLSDLHLGRLVSPRLLDRAADLLAPYHPDAVLFAGDVLDDHIGLQPQAMKQAIARLRAPLGVWGVPGNHEYIAGEVDASLEILRQSGIRMLRDDWTVLDGKVLLVGRDDFSRLRFIGSERAELADILAQVPPAERSLPIIVLDHQPMRPRDAQQAGAILQLSGHTHNGQLWPFNYVVGRLFENSYGYSRVDETHYWVSVGTGTWGPPVRTTGWPEVIVIRLRF